MNRFQTRRSTPPKVTKREQARAFLRKIRRDTLDLIFGDRSKMPDKWEWRVTFPRGEFFVEANTKSEVRGIIKRKFGSVPDNTTITKTGRSPRAEWIQRKQNEFHAKHQPDSAGETEGSQVHNGDGDRAPGAGPDGVPCAPCSAPGL